MDFNQVLQSRRHSAYSSQQEYENFSTNSTDGNNSHTSPQGHSSSGFPRLKRRYIPSLFHNEDKILTRKIKEFLRKPPLNSQEYLDMLWIRRQSEPFHGNEEELRATGSAPASPDELSKKLWYLLPEKRTIQSMILPPIRDGCVANYNNKFKDTSNTYPLIDPSVDIMEQLKYCRYLRPKPNRAWKDTGNDRREKCNFQSIKAI